MNIYVVSKESKETSDQLVKQLSLITLQDNKTTQVIVIDDLYSLAQETCDDTSLHSTSPHFDHFLLDEGSAVDWVMKVDTNLRATSHKTTNSQWVLFEFGQCEQKAFHDFARKLAYYNYGTPTLRSKNIAFLVPSMYLAFFAKTINESFKNLPASQFTTSQSSQVSLLMLSTRIERVFISLPLLTASFIRLKRMAMFIYRRFGNRSKFSKLY